MKTDTNTFTEAAAAHAKVKATIDALRAEYDATSAEIDATDAELERQLGLLLPPDEMKRAVIEILSANARRFEADMRATICEFVQHKFGDVHVPTAARGKPMSYADIESIIAGESSGYGFTNLLRANGLPQVFDAPMFMLFEAVISERLLSILAGIDPSEMGYASIHAADIGCGMAERRALIAKLQADLKALHARRDDLASKLAALGYRVPYKPDRKD